MSNDKEVSDGGYIRVSLQVMYMIVGVEVRLERYFGPPQRQNISFLISSAHKWTKIQEAILSRNKNNSMNQKDLKRFILKGNDQQIAVTELNSLSHCESLIIAVFWLQRDKSTWSSQEVDKCKMTDF